MKDLTKGSIVHHMLFMAGPIAAGMLSQIAYQLVNLYFVSAISPAAIAGVTIASNAILIVAALTQVLAVGTATLTAHATGTGDRDKAMVAFNQAMALALALGGITVAAVGLATRPYLQEVSADPEIVAAGTAFTYAMLPGLVLTFPTTVATAALRGTGVVQAPTIIQMFTVCMNALLAPALIKGWLTGDALGVVGAGLATSISVTVGTVILGAYFRHQDRYIYLRPELWRPRWRTWAHILNIGLPAGGEFALVFLSTAVAYYVIRDFGTSAQAGLAIGSRLVQSALLPSMAIAMTVGPMSGQNFGARNGARIRATFRAAMFLETLAMVVTALVLRWQSTNFVSIFASDAATIKVAVTFLHLRSLDFVAQGVVYTCSNMFQGLGNTNPSLISCAMRFAVFACASLLLARQPRFQLEHLWYLWICSVALQAVISAWLLRLEFKKRLASCI